MDTQIIAQRTAGQHARNRLEAEMAEHGWPEPSDILFLNEGHSQKRPTLLVTMRTAADVHRAAGLMGCVAGVTYFAALDPGETDPAGHWFASRHTSLRINRWCGDVDLQVSRYESVGGGAA